MDQTSLPEAINGWSRWIRREATICRVERFLAGVRQIIAWINDTRQCWIAEGCPTAHQAVACSAVVLVAIALARFVTIAHKPMMARTAMIRRSESFILFLLLVQAGRFCTGLTRINA